MDLYGTAFRNVLFPAWEGVLRRRPTLSILRYLEQTQRRSYDELVAVQAAALRSLARHAYANVPFYRRRFDDAGVHPDRLRSAEDLAALPVLTRADGQQAGDAWRSTVPPFPEIRKSTSGTSGQPLTFGYDLGSEHWRQAVKLRGYGWAGYYVGVRALFFWGTLPHMAPPSRAHVAKVKLDRALKRETYVDCASRSDRALADATEKLRRIRPEMMICYTQAGVDLARYIDREGVRDWPDMGVICAAEKLYPADRDVMKRAFGPRIFETYGSREFMLMASECDAHSLHVPMENIVLEVVVRENGHTRAAAPGEVGEVLVTDLHNYGMPFLRYANGDLAVAGDGGRCACGRGLARISGVEGRTNETLYNAQGDRVGGMTIVVMTLQLGHKLKYYQLVQHRDRSLTFRYAPGPGFDDASLPFLQTSFDKYFHGLPLTFERVEEIAAGATGKRQAIIVEK